MWGQPPFDKLRAASRLSSRAQRGIRRGQCLNTVLNTTSGARTVADPVRDRLVCPVALCETLAHFKDARTMARTPHDLKPTPNRRTFLKGSLIGGAAATLASLYPAMSAARVSNRTAESSTTSGV